MSVAVWRAVIAGVAGFALGVWVTSWRSAGVSDATEADIAARPKDSAESVAGADSRTSVSDAQNARLREELAVARAARAEAETAREAAAIEERLAFFETFSQEVHFNAFTDNLTVTPEMAAAPGFTQEEADAVAGALSHAPRVSTPPARRAR